MGLTRVEWLIVDARSRAHLAGPWAELLLDLADELEVLLARQEHDDDDAEAARH